MNATQTKRVLRELPFNQSIMLMAKHGVGKSSVIRQITEEMGIGFHDVRLSQCEVGDIKGLPFLDETTLTTKFLKPYWWPRDPNSKGFLLFDELNRATKDVLQAVFEICLDRRLDGEKLPDGWRVVAAVNASEHYDVVEFDPALLDRWFCIDFDPSAKEWIKWAISHGIHPAIVDYISQNEEMLDPPLGAMEVGKVYQSRRSWERFHEACQSLGLWDQPEEGMLTAVAKGWLGSTASITFPKFLLNDFARLKPDDVLDELDKVRHKVEAALSDIESIAALSRSVLTTLGKRNASKITPSVINNVKEFMTLLPKDVASSFWAELLKITSMRDDVRKWQSDKEFATFIREIFCK